MENMSIIKLLFPAEFLLLMLLARSGEKKAVSDDAQRKKTKNLLMLMCFVSALFLYKRCCFARAEFIRLFTVCMGLV